MFYEVCLFGIEDLSLLAVFDGHGKAGHLVSEFLRQNLKSEFPKAILTVRNLSGMHFDEQHGQTQSTRRI